MTETHLSELTFTSLDLVPSVAQGIRDSIDELRAAAGLTKRKGRRPARRRAAVTSPANGSNGSSGEPGTPSGAG